ncbi:MAG: glycoside hydrolase family 99-like domain-containing protein [Niabella sp.]|nr:glycoside hydrolase family 99-like domain-containing protein [Niabella sp.]
MRIKVFGAAGLMILALLSGCYAGKQDQVQLPESKSNVQIGAYYFDGWTGKTTHIRDAFVNYPEREPIWGGFVTSTPELVAKQIDLAADAGLDFFSFCWYFDSKNNSDELPMNNALKLYLQAPNHSRLKFYLMVANHKGFYIAPENWAQIKNYWLQAAKDSQYLTVNGKPLLVFFEFKQMLENFGSKQALRQALLSLKQEAKNEGLKGLTIGVCIWPGSNNLQDAVDCGFDLFTGYNYPGSGLVGLLTPIQHMADEEYKVWEQLKKNRLPYIPVSTLNWDIRPWSSNTTTEKRFVGYGEQSVMHSVEGMKKWLMQNGSFTTKEKIGVVYAWNEYGEGSWLTPSLPLKDSLLNGVRRVLK